MSCKTTTLSHCIYQIVKQQDIHMLRLSANIKYPIGLTIRQLDIHMPCQTATVKTSMLQNVNIYVIRRGSVVFHKTAICNHYFFH